MSDATETTEVQPDAPPALPTWNIVLSGGGSCSDADLADIRHALAQSLVGNAVFTSKSVTGEEGSKVLELGGTCVDVEALKAACASLPCVFTLTVNGEAVTGPVSPPEAAEETAPKGKGRKRG